MGKLCIIKIKHIYLQIFFNVSLFIMVTKFSSRTQQVTSEVKHGCRKMMLIVTWRICLLPCYTFQSTMVMQKYIHKCDEMWGLIGETRNINWWVKSPDFLNMVWVCLFFLIQNAHSPSLCWPDLDSKTLVYILCCSLRK